MVILHFYYCPVHVTGETPSVTIRLCAMNDTGKWFKAFAFVDGFYVQLDPLLCLLLSASARMFTATLSPWRMWRNSVPSSHGMGAPWYILLVFSFWQLGTWLRLVSTRSGFSSLYTKYHVHVNGHICQSLLNNVCQLCSDLMINSLSLLDNRQ